MSNEEFDINDIVYANDSSKMTLKSKKILDDLAVQVSLWNSESYQMSLKKVGRYNDSEAMNKPGPLSKSKFKEVNAQVTPKNPSHIYKSGPMNSKSHDLNPKGSVKAKAAYFESLSSNQKNKLRHSPKFEKSLQFPKNDNFTKNSNDCDQISDQENNDPCIDESLPPPPVYVSDTECESLVNYPCPETANNIILPVNDSDTCWSIPESSILTMSEDFTRISSIESSQSTGSLYNDILHELAKIQVEPDAKSLQIFVNEERPKKVRRSLSFNDTLEYIYPSSIESSEHLEKLNIGINHSHETPSSMDNQSMSFLDITQSFEPDFCVVALEMEKNNLKKQGKELLENMKLMLSNLQFQVDTKFHTDMCRKIIKNSLMTKSITEKIHMGPQQSEAIMASLHMENIRFKIKTGYALIDYEGLLAQGLSHKLKKLSIMFHLILFVRCHGGTGISESRIFTLIDKNEAVKMGLPFQDLSWLEMFCYIKFHNLSSRFRLIFDVYCMQISPKKQLLKQKETPRKHTPIKKFLCNSPKESLSVSYFTNIGSFETSAKCMESNGELITKQLNIPSSYPLNGRTKFTESLSLVLMNKCEGRLNIYMDVGNVGAWAYRDCQLTSRGIIGGKRSVDSENIEDVDVVIPFWLCNGLATRCDYSICAKADSFSILLSDAGNNRENLPMNKRLSTDGKKKNRFLAAATNDEDVNRWCYAINEAKDSFLNWANDIDDIDLL